MVFYAISKISTITKILQQSGTKNTPVQNKLLHKSHSNCCQGTLLTGGVGLQLSSAVPQSKSFVYKSCSEQNLRFGLAGSTENFCNFFIIKYPFEGVFIFSIAKIIQNWSFYTFCSIPTKKFIHKNVRKL